MNIQVSSFYINDVKVWIIIQALYGFKTNEKLPSAENGFLCYFRFSDPFDFIEGEFFNYIEGELIKDESENLKIFLSVQEIELFALNYIKKRLDF